MTVAVAMFMTVDLGVAWKEAKVTGSPIHGRYAEALKELEAELHEARLTSSNLEVELGGAKLEGESAEEAKVRWLVWSV